MLMEQKNIIETFIESIKEIVFVSLVLSGRKYFKISCGFPCAT